MEGQGGLVVLIFRFVVLHRTREFNEAMQKEIKSTSEAREQRKRIVRIWFFFPSAAFFARRGIFEHAFQTIGTHPRLP